GYLAKGIIRNKKIKNYYTVDIIDYIGNHEDPNTYSDIVIEEKNLPNNFSEEILNEVKCIKAYKKIEGVDNREDLRDIPFITIDPFDAKDHDDAVWAEQDKNPKNRNGWHIIVAIADVSYYVTPNSKIDIEAYKRANSIYFPNKVIPMLPEKLSNNLCSLKKNADRPVISVHIFINNLGDIIKYDFKRSIINSKASLNYEQVEKIFNKENDYKIEANIKKTINALFGANKALTYEKNRRIPLEISQDEVTFNFNNYGRIKNISLKKNLESHKLIENYMILANICVANKLVISKRKAIYRIHDKPSSDKMFEFYNTAKSLDLNLLNYTLINTELFNKLFELNNLKYSKSTINQLILRSQSQAEYSSDNKGHFGLSLKNYTHFTSPIRRYSDLITHRILLDICELNNKQSTIYDKLDSVAKKLSINERNTVLAERDIKDKLIALYFSKKEKISFTAHISYVVRYGLFVTLDKYNIDGLLTCRDLGKEYFYFDPDKNYLLGEKTKTQWKIGDKIDVFIKEVDIIQGKIKFSLKR
ncbi:VacB/RNase II family 3'-5' exoribonuclease, partial [Alphaproteobacteria bacterium]|nr:VacB/RNase II family 3'-5' exoribonuclease [Alphaproteobacteria bacterium]